MARILGIDYGIKRCGIAVTDPLQIAVHGLIAIDKKELHAFLSDYIENEKVEKVVFGHPEFFSGRKTPVVQSMTDFVTSLKKDFKDLEVDFHDESFTSEKASELILKSGVGRKKRRDKGLVDKISAVLILQDYLGHL